MSNKYFQWIADCCKELNWDIKEGAALVQDVNWFGCYDDGMTAKDAVKEAISEGVVSKRKKISLPKIALKEIRKSGNKASRKPRGKE